MSSAHLDNGLVYDRETQYRLLGLTLGDNLLPPPEPMPGFITVWCEWPLIALKENPRVRAIGLMAPTNLYDGFDQPLLPTQPSYYRLRVPVPDSNNRTFEGQQKLLLPGEEIAPLTIAVTALLVHSLATLRNHRHDVILLDNCMRCAEVTRQGRMALGFYSNRLWFNVYASGDYSDSRVWVAAAQRIH